MSPWKYSWNKQQIPPSRVGLKLFDAAKKAGRRPSPLRMKMLPSLRDSSAATPHKVSISPEPVGNSDYGPVTEVVVVALQRLDHKESSPETIFPRQFELPPNISAREVLIILSTRCSVPLMCAM